LNAEIEHASPYGKDVGEKVPGEKKKIGPARADETTDVPPYPDDVNCDLDRPKPKPHGLRPSDLLIGTAALLPVAIKVGRSVKKKVSEDRRAA
jgi:hypothetical protein